MAILTIHQGHQTFIKVFEAPMPLSALITQAGISFGHPCGGHGICGKCAVMIKGDVSSPNASERRLGVRLSCQAVIDGDAEVTLPTASTISQIAGGSAADIPPVAPMCGRYGAAIDIGTTTLALLLYDLNTGRCIAASGMLNPQTSIAADVIGRIDASLKGHSVVLREQIETAVDTLMISACAHAQVTSEQVESFVVTGNTTMLYLITGRNPVALSRAPFEVDCIFGEETKLLCRSAYLPDCLHAFVGADTACAVLASGMTASNQTALLCDVGTNGEIALWHQGKLFIASTAAGPAFEGAGISCGCGSVPGAIDHVENKEGILNCHTIGDTKAVGLCGSGLVDTIAALLDTEIIDETGYMEDDSVPLRDGISLTQADIRAVQLAKAAIYAGIMCLLQSAGCPPSDVMHFYLAGGFGSHLNIRSATRIGLIPAEFADKVCVIGNAALDGAAILLMNTGLREQVTRLRQLSHHVRLDGNPAFSERYIDAMLFE